MAKKNKDRINFIESSPLVFSYKKVMSVMTMILFLFGCLAGLQVGRVHWLERQVKSLNVNVTQLKAEQERVARSHDQEKEKSLAEAQRALLQIFDHDFAWTTVLREMSAQMTPSLWLTDIDSGSLTGTLDPILKIKGRADHPDAISGFVKAMYKSKHFTSVILASAVYTTGTLGHYYEFQVDASARKELDRP